jgi:hypothetical protein
MKSTPGLSGGPRHRFRRTARTRDANRANGTNAQHESARADARAPDSLAPSPSRSGERELDRAAQYAARRRASNRAAANRAIGRECSDEIARGRMRDAAGFGPGTILGALSATGFEARAFAALSRTSASRPIPCRSASST